MSEEVPIEYWKPCDDPSPHSHCPHVDCPDCPGVCREVMRIYTVSLNASDLPDGYAVREWRIAKGGPPVPGLLLASGLAGLEQARDAVPPWADACLTRSPGDDPSIVETWI